MPAEPLLLGPFVGGMNNASDPSAVADAELVSQINFELDQDGALKSRPPYVGFNGPGAWGSRIAILCSGVFPSGVYLIGSNSTGTYFFDGATWTLITAKIAGAAVQYKNKIWLVPSQNGTDGGNWDPVGGYTAVATIPQGNACVIHKERLFIVPGRTTNPNSSRLFFSDPGDFTTYPGANNLDINPGDGTTLIDLITYNDNLILFKEDSTFVLAYDTKPADAVLRNISTTIGATTYWCVVKFENSVFIYHEGDVFEMVNYDFAKINVKLRFEYDPSGPSARSEVVHLSVVNERLVVRYFNRVYVFGLRTRTWGQWISVNSELNNIGRFVLKPSSDFADVNDEYWAGSGLTSSKTYFRIKDLQESGIRENFNGVNADIQCSIMTKNFDFAVSHMFKKLAYWGADVLTGRSITGIATPVVVGVQTLWQDIDNILTWAQLGTWANPLGALPYVTTPVSNTQGAFSIHVKFLRALRFRKINFQIQMLTAGNTLDGPAKIFTLTVHVLTKEVVPKSVN